VGKVWAKVSEVRIHHTFHFEASAHYICLTAHPPNIEEEVSGPSSDELSEIYLSRSVSEALRHHNFHIDTDDFFHLFMEPAMMVQ
jgi:hypothetical protein